VKKLKSKILAGLLFFLFLILLLSLTGIFSIYYLSYDSKEIIKDNYASVEHCTNMLNSLESIFNNFIQKYSVENDSYQDSILREKIIEKQKIFEKHFQMQQNNITEIGENKLVSAAYKEYQQFALALKLSGMDIKKSRNDLMLIQSGYLAISKSIKEIYKLNMTAIYNKNITANNTANRVSVIMAIATAISIILTIIFVFYFPAYITSPISELTQKIEYISNRKYDQRIQIKSNDEFKTLAEAFNKMAVKLKNYEEQHIDELILEKRRMETLVANLQDGSLLLDNEFRILHANKKFCELSDLSVNDLLNKKLFEIENKNELINSLISFNVKDIQSDISPGSKLINLTINGRSEYFQILLLEISKTHKNDFRTEPSGYIALVQNITHYEERDLAKTNLIATISHELKTPLSSINISLKLLGDSRIGILNDEQKKLIESVKMHSGRILKLVNEVLDFAQVETGHIKLKIDSHKVGDIIELGTFAVLVLLNEKEIELEVLSDDELPKIKCDIEKTVWVMVNLLNNAIRYSYVNGKIIIQANLIDKFVRISIIDAGQGISLEEQTKIFEKYVTSKSKSIKGTGLGLAIAKEFVEVQGGIIGVESTPGKGSTFYFTLPAI
jgi:two-component system, NtrC family, sensor histidine kinase KinB